MVTATLDAECFALARYVLSDDEKLRRDPELYAVYCHDLALLIQRTVDEFLFARMPPMEDSTCNS